MKKNSILILFLAVFAGAMFHANAQAPYKEGIGVILDFAPVHFANDPWALAEYDGSCLFEYSNEHRVSP